MGSNTAPERPPLIVGETRNDRVSFKGNLDAGELLTGTPLVVEVTTTNLTLTSKAINTSTIAVGADAAVLAGQAVQFTVAGQLAATGKYKIQITVTTDGGQTLVKYVWLLVASE